ncbi:MAG: hypothetical protein CBB71_18245, partial [Rhodopirellula sp. TMED11]
MHSAGAGCDGPACPGTSSNTQQSSTSTTSQNRNIRTSQSPSLDALRGLVADDVGEEAALHLDTNLEEISVDSVLADVDSDPVCGRPTDVRDRQLVRMLVRHGASLEQCKMILLNYLITIPAVTEALQLMLGGLPSATSADIAPVFRSFSPHDRPFATLGEDFLTYLTRLPPPARSPV